MAFRLPVSQLNVEFREPTGADDVRLMEAREEGVALALWLVSTLESASEPLPWETLSITDLDAAILAVRRQIVGETIATTVRCECGERIDIEFGVTDYLAQHKPRPPRSVKATEPAGWFRLDGVEALFRLPSCEDQLALARQTRPLSELSRRCFDPSPTERRARRRLEAAMEAMAPNLFGLLEGVCPQCRAPVQMAFDPQLYVLEELRQRAAFVLDEVHLIAARYQWSEREILALPQKRRAHYAELISESHSSN